MVSCLPQNYRHGDCGDCGVLGDLADWKYDDETGFAGNSSLEKEARGTSASSSVGAWLPPYGESGEKGVSISRAVWLPSSSGWACVSPSAYFSYTGTAELSEPSASWICFLYISGGDLLLAKLVFVYIVEKADEDSASSSGPDNAVPLVMPLAG